MIKRWPTLPFGRLLGYSLMMVAPTVLALDWLVYERDLVIDHAIWVVASAMVSAIAIVWLFLGELTGMARYTDKIAAGDKNDLPQLNTKATRVIANRVAQLDGKWRQQVHAFSQSIDADMQILESLVDPLILVSSAGRVVRANATARVLFGRSLGDEVIETALRPTELLNAVQAALEQRQPQALDLEWRGYFTRYFDVRIMPIEMNQGDEVDVTNAPSPIAAVITLHETTEMHRAAEMREEFIANVSHELRTPLSVVSGFVETLQGLEEDEPALRKKFLGIMYEQTTRMTRLVSDLLSLSRLDEQDAPLEERVEFSSIVQTLASAMAIQAAARSITIEQDLETGLYLKGDYDQLYQLVQNLLQNAINYGSEGGKVCLSAKREEGQIVFSVSDDGDGIAPEHIPHLGERFYRVDASRSRVKGGSGLGLAIVQGILHRHNGSLSIESGPGEGSLFTARLPVGE